MTLLELAHQRGLKPRWVAGTNGGEYHSPCPVCGGKDRFYIQPNRQMSRCLGSYQCRQCGIYGDAIEFARRFLNFSFQDAADALKARITQNIFLHQINKPITLVKPPSQWTINATEYLEIAHSQLLKRKDIIKFLEQRGLPLEAIKRYKLGWSNTTKFFLRNSWGLSEENTANGKSRSLWIPRGLIIPTVDLEGAVLRLKVRRFDWHENDSLPKYVCISGSMNGLNIIGNRMLNTMVVVESELDAYAIDHIAGDFAFAAAVGSNIKNPDNVSDSLAKRVTKLLICHDNDVAGKKMLTKWKKLYPHAKAYPTPIGKDIGEALEKGFDIKKWIQKTLLS